jgi:hypothetical protein
LNFSFEIKIKQSLPKVDFDELPPAERHCSGCAFGAPGQALASVKQPSAPFGKGWGVSGDTPGPHFIEFLFAGILVFPGSCLPRSPFAKIPVCQGAYLP